ncbi:hypothetical protein KC19_2G147600 [Ceratodon purpureus]|uniref:EIPR1-like beta-propeller domain-containing protein n=1 Tax=Ceratodon purpureus TaxID=3225 RepID=A0A8T0IWV5_CERPU|nr:hypothetical protein KC19_2G147600 [Ceratodon purpureus]
MFTLRPRVMLVIIAIMSMYVGICHSGVILITYFEAYAVFAPFQARCISAQTADRENNRWLVGTLSLRYENEVHVLQLGENSSELVCQGLYTHRDEIWDIAACPFNTSLFSTVYSRAGETGTAVWKIPESRGNKSVVLPVEVAASLSSVPQQWKCTLWWPSGQHPQVASIGTEKIVLWNVEFPQNMSQASAGGSNHLEVGSWDPHDFNNIATASEGSIQCWDLRTMSSSTKIDQAHVLQTRHIDFNPQKKHLIATAGDDSWIRIWDLRKPSSPLHNLLGHHHWTVRVKYNPKYEELILSSGTDAVVNLWRVIDGSLTKSPSGLPRGLEDSLLRSYTEHEDSVYGIAWSALDPWVFASVDYDGRVSIGPEH